MQSYPPEFLPLINNAFIFVLGLLLSLVIWVGRKLDKRLDEINGSIQQTNHTLTAIERDIRDEVTALDRRITRVETKCDGHHGRREGNGNHA